MLKKRICVVTSLHEASDARIFEKECKSLARRYDVYLVAPNTESKDVDGVHVVGVDLPDINHRLKRWLTLDKIIPTLIQIDAEVYHFHDPELIPIGLKVKKNGKIVVFDSHEDVPRQILSKPFIPTTLLRKLVSLLYEQYEKSKLKKYDALVSVTPEIVERLRKVNRNSYMLTNYPIYKEQQITRKWDKKIAFAGLISDDWNLDKVIDAIKDNDIRLELAGFYATDTYIKHLKGKVGWKNVNYLGRLKHSEVFELLSRCSAGMAIQSDNNPNMGGKKGSIGITKVYEYMMAGIPVIATDLENWIPIVEGNECGYCVNCNDVNVIKEKILYLINHPDEAKRLGDNGRRAVKEKYSWQTQENVLFEMYEKLLS